MKKTRLPALMLALLMAASILLPALADGPSGPSPWDITKLPTCTEPGERVRWDGNRMVKEAIPPTGHSYGPATLIKEATCLERAREQATCKVCGHTAWQYTGDLAPHTWSEWTVVQEPAEDVYGIRKRNCTVCGKEETQEFVDAGTQTLPVHDESELSIGLESKLVDDRVYHANEDYTFELTLSNNSDQTLYLDSYNDSLDGGWPQSMDPFETYTCYLKGTIDTADCNKAYYQGGILFKPLEVTYVDSNDAPATANTVCQLQIAEAGHLRDLTLAAYVVGGKKEPYYENDAITFHVTVTNTGTIHLNDVCLYNAYEMPVGHVTLDPGKSYSEDFTYIVTADDANDVNFEVRFAALGKDPISGMDVWPDDVYIGLIAGALGHESGGYLTLAGTGTAPEIVTTGTVIPVQLVATNEGLAEVIITGLRCNPIERNYMDKHDEVEDAIVTTGIGFTCNYKIIVTDEDIEAGIVQRDFMMDYIWYEGPEPIKCMTNTVQLTFDLTESDDHAELLLTCESFPAPGAGVGDQVGAKFTLRNTGNVPVMFSNIFHYFYPGCNEPPAGEDISEWIDHFTEIMEPGDEITVNQYTNVVPQDMEAGAVVREVYAEGTIVYANSDENTMYSNTAQMKIQLTDEEAADPVTIVKERIGEPKDPSGYQLNEVIHYSMTVTNTSDTVVTGLAVGDNLQLETQENSVIESRKELQPGESWTVPFDYTVSEEGLKFAPTLFNQAWVIYNVPGEDEDYITYSNIVSAPLYVIQRPDDIILLKRCVNDPDNHLFYQPGEKIKYEVEIRNNSNATYSSVTIYDPLGAETYPYGLIGNYTNVMPGFTDIITYEYSVTYPDAVTGMVENHARAIATAQNHGFEVTSNKVIRPAGLEEKHVELLITKKEISTPDKEGKYALGEWIDYEIYVKNVGNVILTNVEISDTLKTEDYGVLVLLPQLLPGEEHTELFSYQVRAEDICEPYEVWNHAIANAQFEDGWPYYMISEPVISPTRGEKKEKSAPSDDSCVRTLVSKGADTAEYTLTYCAEHQHIADEISALIRDEAPETAYPKAEALWREALDSLYKELMRSQPTDSGAAILNSYIAYRRYLDNYAAALTGKTEAEISKLLSEQIMLRCIDLCYALHHAPDPKRPDSVITGHYQTVILGVNPNACVYRVYTDQSKRLRLRELICNHHMMVDETLLTRVHEMSAPDQIAAVFESAEFNYRNIMAVRVASAGRTLGNTQQRVNLIWQASATHLLDCDAALWEALYPDHPEISAEITWREAREMVITMCNP